MAEALTIARPYAEAAFKLASEQGALAPWSQVLEALSTIMTTDSAAELANSPSLKTDKVAEVLAEIAGDLNTEQKGFVRVLAENGRLSVLPEIASLYSKLRNEAEGSLQAVIQSAFDLNDSQLADIVATLEQKFGRKVSASVEVAPELIGGVSIRIGDEVMDASVRGKLSQLAGSLKV